MGKKELIIHAFYVGKRAGEDYWRRVQSVMDEMGFKSYKADPEIWFCYSVKYYGTDYYQYVLLYTNNILAIMKTLKTLYVMC